MKPQRLRSRVALAFGALSLLVAVVVAVGGYLLVQAFLVAEREDAARARTQADAAAIDRSNAVSPDDELASVAPGGGVQKLLLVDDRWYASGVTVSPDDLPGSLIDVAARAGSAGSLQRFTVGDTLYLGVAVPVDSGIYVELFRLNDLASTLAKFQASLAVVLPVAVTLGAAIGWYAAGRVLRPLRRMAATADDLAAGQLDRRMEPSVDPDLAPIGAAFNDMADSMQSRINRERRFVANVSHELRTPVTAAMGTIELLDARSADIPPSSSALLATLGQQVTRLARMVLDLLELGTITPETTPHLEEVDLTELLRTVTEHGGCDPALVDAATPIRVTTDPRRLERIVANLIDNAETHGGGLTAVRVRTGPGDVQIVIDDDGPGVPEHERSSIFELFNRGAESVPGSGSGLGLSIVREQAEVLNGHVEVTDAPTGGARFVVSLPRSPVDDDSAGGA